MSLIDIPLDKSIDSLTGFFQTMSRMPKKRQDKVIYFTKRILIIIGLFIVIILATYGIFIRGNKLW